MQTYFVQMNEDYISKYYPNRSVFSSVNKSNQKNGIGIYAFFGIFMVMSGLGTAWGIISTMESIKEGESDMVAPGLVIIGFFFVIFALSIFTIIFTKKRNSLGAEGLIKKSAKNSQYSESEIREFELQAMASDSYVLALTDKMKAVLSGQKNGVLTRDFIYLADFKNIVMKRCDIVGAFLVERTFYINGDKYSRKPVKYLTVTIVSNKNIQILAETSIEAGKGLLEMLQEQNPKIDTKNCSVIQEKEYNKYCKMMLPSHS
ncbi:hypothetical protein [Lacrimispora sp.]|uniref:hypothetical protein n=1 Tax=Lacrimispora sp. TaxID=2719234 RepID=UPI0028AAAF33|nr:hypothetical protein [Lacrimispora sp.]